MKRILIAAAGLIALTGSALAADMAPRTYTKAPPPIVAPIYSWTGFYVGGFFGGAWGDRKASVSDPCAVGTLCTTVGTYNAVTPALMDLSASYTGGANAGYNWQTGAWVYGLEAEVGYLNARGALNPFGASDTTAFTNAGLWYGVFTARVGYAVDRTLFYVKGGAAVTRFTNGVVDTFETTINSTTSHDAWGWAAGAGVEYALNNNWSIKGEYLYLGVRKTYVDSAVVNLDPGSQIFNVTSRDPGIHTAKIGINYKWGGPVVARY
jgi:outer membrane immunogenic protein